MAVEEAGVEEAGVAEVVVQAGAAGGAVAVDGLFHLVVLGERQVVALLLRHMETVEASRRAFLRDCRLQDGRRVGGREMTCMGPGMSQTRVDGIIVTKYACHRSHFIPCYQHIR